MKMKSVEDVRLPQDVAYVTGGIEEGGLRMRVDGEARYRVSVGHCCFSFLAGNCRALKLTARDQEVNGNHPDPLRVVCDSFDSRERLRAAGTSLQGSACTGAEASARQTRSWWRIVAA
jgi:hypothetical protein